MKKALCIILCALLLCPAAVLNAGAAEARPIFSVHTSLNQIEHLNDGWYVGEKVPTYIGVGGITLESTPLEGEDDGHISCNKRRIREVFEDHELSAVVKVLTSDGYFADPQETFEENKRYVIVVTLDHGGLLPFDFNWADNATVGQDYVENPDGDGEHLRPVYVTVGEKSANRIVLYCPLTVKGRRIREMHVSIPEPCYRQIPGYSDRAQGKDDLLPTVPENAPYTIGNITWSRYDGKKEKFVPLTDSEIAQGFLDGGDDPVRYRLSFSVWPKEGYTFTRFDSEAVMYINGEMFYVYRSLDWWLEHPGTQIGYVPTGDAHLNVSRDFTCPGLWASLHPLIPNRHTLQTAWIKADVPQDGDEIADYKAFNCLSPMTGNDRFTVDDSLMIEVFNGQSFVKPAAGETFKAGKKYRFTLFLTPEPDKLDFNSNYLIEITPDLWNYVGYEFADAVSVLVNGSADDVLPAWRNTDGKLVVQYDVTVSESVRMDKAELIAKYPPVDDALTGYPMPKTGSDGYSVQSVNWYGYPKGTTDFSEENAIKLDPFASFNVGLFYEMRITLKANAGWYFSPSLSDVVINEQTLPAYKKGVTESNCYIKNADGTLTLRYRFDMAGDDIPVITGYINQNGTAYTGRELRFGVKVDGKNVVYRWFVVENVNGEVRTREINYLMEDEGYDYYLTNEIRFTPTAVFCAGQIEVLYYYCTLTNTGGEIRSKNIFLNFSHYDTDGKYDADETNHWHRCVCESLFDVEPHVFQDVQILKTPTDTEPGEKTVECAVCGYQTKQTFQKALSGDVDGDAKVTAADARLTLRAAVGLEAYAPGSAQFIAADADKDGSLTAGDARAILRAAVGLEELA